MRTEVKIATVAGLVVIAVTVFFLVSQGKKDQAEVLPVTKAPEGTRAEAPRPPVQTPRPAGPLAARPPGASTPTGAETPTGAPPAARPAPGGLGGMPPAPATQPSVPPPRTPAATPPVVAESAQPGAMREPNAPELSSLPPLATPEPARTSPVPGGGLQPTARPAVAEPSSVSRAPAGETPALPGAGAAAERETGRPAPPSPATAGERYIVKEGDKLAYIAEDYYGDQAAVKQILEANPNIKDPDLIQVGQVIMLPPKGAPGSARSPVAPASPDRAAAPTRTPAAPAPATTPPAAGGAPVAAGRPRTHLVRQGETLTSIARTVLGDASKWRQILELNKDKLDRPEDLQAGMSIKLPDDSGAQGSRTATPTAPTRTAPPRESVRPRR